MEKSLSFACAFLFWNLAFYLSDTLSARKPRGGGKTPLLTGLPFAVLLAWMGCWAWQFCLMACMLLAAPFFARGKRRWIPLCYAAEYELSMQVIPALLFWAISTKASVSSWLLRILPASSTRPLVFALSAALLCFAVFGGSACVRGVLQKSGVKPETRACANDQKSEDRRGETIGRIERAIVFLLVIAGSLPTLAFFFAAKGLVRSRELEERSMADYFLLGSLCSFLIALSAGLLARQAIAVFWK